MPVTTMTPTSATSAVAASPRAPRPQQAGPTSQVRHVESTGEHQVIMAERFKTKHCRTFQQTGACPYEFKCMFAHGQAELRTQADNERDSLTSEDAVKTWQRARRAAKLAAIEEEQQSQQHHHQAPAVAPAPAVYNASVSQTTPLPEPFAASPTSPTIPKPRSHQIGCTTTRGCTSKFHVTDVVVKEMEYKNLTPVCAAWVSALLTPASPSHWSNHHSDHGLAPASADDYFQSNGGLIG